jgi:RNA polymerase-associated protein LEO1
MQGILQSQGRLLQKMRFMPSSLSSKSHRLLTALVDSQNKKTVKMQKWFETKDPEKVKQENERVTKSPSLYPPDVMYVHDLFFPTHLN